MTYVVVVVGIETNTMTHWYVHSYIFNPVWTGEGVILHLCLLDCFFSTSRLIEIEKKIVLKILFILKGDSMNLTLIDNYVVESFFF